MTFNGSLHPYQKPAFDLMVDRRQALVAYDMGTGKTVLTIAAIEDLMDGYSIREPGIVLCLSSLKFQWADEILRWSDSKPLVIDGPPSKRKLQYEQCRNWREAGVDYIIMTYDTLVNDAHIVSGLPRGFIVADECTSLRSFRSKRSRVIKRFARDIPVRFGLTGTPMENGKPEEVFSIMEFVDPSVLGRFDLFDRTFIVRNGMGWIDRYRNLDTLHRTLSKAMVRKRQNDPDVSPYLPKEIHPDPILVPMTPSLSKVYSQVRDELLMDLDEASSLFGESFDLSRHYGRSDGRENGSGPLMGSLMSKMTCLRMLCQHPELLRVSASLFADQLGQGSEYAHHLVTSGMLPERLSSPKLAAAVSYVRDQLELDDRSKVVIFSSFLGVLPLLRDELRQYGSAMFTGDMSSTERDASKKDFQRNPKTRIFLSSDAGGYGVDLPQANVLINYDLPWSSGTFLQRNARIRRASSTWKHVVVQDVIMSGSIEERQHRMLVHKSALSDAVLDGVGINARGGIDLSLGSLRSFLESSKKS